MYESLGSSHIRGGSSAMADANPVSGKPVVNGPSHSICPQAPQPHPHERKVQS